MKFAFRAALSLCLLLAGLPAFAQQYSGSGPAQQPAAYWLLVSATTSGPIIRPQGGNYTFHISGTFGGATVALVENFGANSQTLGSYTSAPSTDPCFAIPQGATVQVTVTGGAPSGLYASIGGVDGGCGVGSGGGSGGNVNLTGINGVTPLVGAGATGTGSPRTTQAQDTSTIAGSAPGTAGTPSAQVLTVQNPTSNRVRGHATSTDTSAHTMIAAGTTGIKTYITGIQCSRSDAGTTPITLTFSDDVASTMDIPDAGNGGANNFVLTGSPFATAAATAFTFTSSSGVTTVKCNAQGYQGP